MKIKNIELQNFKFHEELRFNISKYNCLIYGENGTGKSSIYWSLVSIFKNNLVTVTDFKNRNMPEDSEFNVIINLDDNTTLNLEEANELVQNNQNTIYFAHQDMLEDFLTYSDNFFDILNDKIKEHFQRIYDFSVNLNKFNIETNVENYREQVFQRIQLTNEYQKFLEEVVKIVNEIINNNFDEKFNVNFEYDWDMLILDKNYYTFGKPKIILKIENQDKLKLQFNEAKLKLVSIAIFFALIKLEENRTNPLKLLVLDDFLTSLDMANRRLIMKYILDNFGEYQKIILTHNIQFYNLIVKFLKSRKNNKQKEELSDWDIKNIFLTEENKNMIANIYNMDENYLKQAKSEFKKGGFQNLKSSGNFLRKEFERIMSEFEQLLEVGKKEELNNIILVLKGDNKYFYHNPHEKLEEIIVKFNKMLDNEDQTNEKKMEQVKKTINRLEKNVIIFKEISNSTEKEMKNNIVTEVITRITENKTYNILQKVDFYKNILLNPSSHDNIDIEIYRKECKATIEVLNHLNKILNELK